MDKDGDSMGGALLGRARDHTECGRWRGGIVAQRVEQDAGWRSVVHLCCFAIFLVPSTLREPGSIFVFLIPALVTIF